MQPYRRRWPFILILFCFTSVIAQQKTRLIDNWEFLRKDLGSAWEAVRPIPKADAPETSPIWQRITLPHCVNAEDAVDPDLNYYQGPAWYRTRLSIQNPYPGGRTILFFEGAGQKTSVYVYTTLVGEHVGGYDEFSIDITDAVEEFRKTEEYKQRFNSTIPISIRTDNSRDPEMIPSNLSDFTIYGGIYRYLNLVYLPAVSIDKLFISAETGKAGARGQLTISPRFYNPAGQMIDTFTIRVLDPSGELIKQEGIKISPGSDFGFIAFLLMKPRIWSPDNPELYTVEAILGNYKHVEKIGFRHFEFVPKGPFLLNGSRLLLKGTHRHEDHAGVGAALTEELMREEMIAIKQMGVNFIRLGHYQQSSIVLNLCDSLGILVWEEIPWCRGGLGGAVYKEQGRRMLTNMIEQHFNHPSVIIWGLGNENDWPGDFPEFDTASIREYMKELNMLSHKLDPSRKTAIRRCDFCKDIPDIYSPSIWAGWYRGIYTDYKKISETEFQKTRHFLHVEWGADSHAGRHSEKHDQLLRQVMPGASKRTIDSLYIETARLSKDGNWDETYACNLFDWHLKEQETMPWLTGTASWTFKDFSTPLRPTNPVPYVNQKGVVERDGTKKESYYVFQSYWATQPMVHIYGHSWPVRWGAEGEEKMIKVYSNCEQAELFVNGKSYGKKNRNSQDYPAAGLRWNIPLTKGQYHVKVVAVKGSVVVTDSLLFFYQSERWESPAKTELEKIKEENDIVTVQVKLLDEKNIRCLDGENWVRFALVGEGRMIDNQGTTSGSSRVQLNNGAAVIRVRMNGGQSVLSVAIHGVPGTFINLSITK